MIAGGGGGVEAGTMTWPRVGGGAEEPGSEAVQCPRTDLPPLAANVSSSHPGNVFTAHICKLFFFFKHTFFK